MYAICIDMEETGKRINALRTEKGLSYMKLAELMGVSVYAIVKWATGKSVPTLRHVLQMMELFQITKVKEIIIYTTKEEKL